VGDKVCHKEMLMITEPSLFIFLEIPSSWKHAKRLDSHNVTVNNGLKHEDLFVKRIGK
jgi:hypothetical protein